MCGIVGYKGESEAQKRIYTGLENLEYRGYDSAGIATVGNPSIKVDKGVGTISEVLEKQLDGNTGIGHTRWATHGGVNRQNAHPHTSCNGNIAVVHNGIIENYNELKEQLSDHEFSSETDTEVIPHLVEELRQENNIVECMKKLKQILEGSYAIVVTFENGKIAGMRRGSPLVLGVGENETFLASDVTSFLEYTDNVVFLEEGDIVKIEDEGSYTVFNNGKADRRVEKVEWDAEEASKEGYKHFMKKEIMEQSETVKRAAFQDRSDMEKAVEMIEEAEEIYVTGCGTSGIVSSLGAKYLRSSGVDCISEMSHELEYRTSEIGEDDLVIAVSQSGETADLLSTLKQTDAEVLAVVNVVGSTLARNSDHCLYVNAGPEIAVASTKATTAQITVFDLLSKAIDNRLEEGRNQLIETAESIGSLIDSNMDKVEELSNYFMDKDQAYFIGRNKGYDVARESCLKFKEVTYTHSEAFPGGEFKHGNLALVEEGTPLVSFLKTPGYEDIVSNTIEARSRGADIIGVGKQNQHDFENFLEIPENGNQEIYEIILFQLISYKTSVKKGVNPDKPRNLAKSVTVK